MAAAAGGPDLLDRIGEQFIFADRLVGQLVDKAGIRAILEQTADQISEQIAVPADRGIGSAMIAFVTHQPLKQALAHAVQPLKLKIAAVSGPLQQCRHGQRVVRGKGGADIVRRKHVTRAGEIRHIGRRLAGEQREIRKPAFLRMFDFAIPIRSLHQPHLHDALRRLAERIGPGNRRSCTFRISLNRHAEAIPASQSGIARHAFNDVETHLQPCRFFSIDRQLHTQGRCRPCQLADHFGEFRHAIRSLRRFISRVQRRELYRHAMPARRVLTDGGNRADIGFEIAFGIGLGPCGFAEHIKAGGKAAIFLCLHPLHGFLDGPAHNKHLPHQPHRRAHALANKWLTRARDQALQAAVTVAQHRFAQHQPPCRAVDQHARRLPLMPAPIGIGQLVGDEQIGGFGVRHTQESFGQRQQSRAFFSSEPIFLQELIYPTVGLRRTQIGEQPAGLFDNRGPLTAVNLGCNHQGRQHLRLCHAVKRTDGGAGGIKREGHAPRFAGYLRHGQVSDVTKKTSTLSSTGPPPKRSVLSGGG